MASMTTWVVVVIHLLFKFIVAIRQGTTAPGSAEEVCAGSKFNASCNANEIILMKKATYGRMRIGHCVQEDHGHTGCHGDVISHMDELCSGRRRCSLDVPDPALHSFHNCPKELYPYLEVVYECISVAMNEGQVCGRSRPLEVTRETGYLASSVAEETGFGAPNCPWMLRASPGRTFKLTLYHFPTMFVHGKTPLRGCETIMTIKEAMKTRNITLCGGDARMKDIYFSSSNVIEVSILTPRRITQESGRFIVKYEAVGCPDLPNTANSWTERDHSKSIIRCNFTEETFFLSCEGSSWVGEIGNCTNPAAWKGRGLHRSHGSFPYGILVVIGIGVAMGVAMGIILLMAILVCVRRRKKRTLKSATTDPLLDNISHDHDDAHSQCQCGAKIYYSTALECQLAAMRSQQGMHAKTDMQHSYVDDGECPTREILHSIPELQRLQQQQQQHQRIPAAHPGERGPMPDMCILEARPVSCEGQAYGPRPLEKHSNDYRKERQQEQTSFITFKPTPNNAAACTYHPTGLQTAENIGKAPLVSHYGTLTKPTWNGEALNMEQTKNLLADSTKPSRDKEASNCPQKWKDMAKDSTEPKRAHEKPNQSS